MTNKKELLRYAEIKIQIAHLTDEANEIKDKVAESVEKEGGKVETPLGNFTMKKGRTTWVYSEELQKKAEALKLEQIDEQESKVAKKIEGAPSLNFNPAKL